MLAPNNSSTASAPDLGATFHALVADLRGISTPPVMLAGLQYPSFPIELSAHPAGAKISAHGKSDLTDHLPGVDPTFARLVESALKHLYDIPVLSRHPLARLFLVSAKLQSGKAPFTSLDRARALHELLHLVIEQLRPPGPCPTRGEVPHRGWHPYLILASAYVRDEPNNQIMSWLQIGEGTFNRTRRRALETCAQALFEMELQTRQEWR